MRPALAFRRIRLRMPDVVILDQDMPRRTGLEVLAQIRAAPLTWDLPVLLLTALARRDLLIRGFEQGLDDFITKPFDSAELTLRIRALAARARRVDRRTSHLQRIAEASRDRRERNQMLWIAVALKPGAPVRGVPDLPESADLLRRTAARLAEIVMQTERSTQAHFFLRRDGSAWVQWPGAAPNPRLLTRFARLRDAAERLFNRASGESCLRLLHVDLDRPELYGQPGLEAALAEEMARPLSTNGVRSLSL